MIYFRHTFIRYKMLSFTVLLHMYVCVCSGQYGLLHIMLCLCNHFYLFLAKIRHTFFYWSKRVDQGTAWTYFCDILKPIYPGFSTFSSWIILVSAVTSDYTVYTHVDVPIYHHTQLILHVHSFNQHRTVDVWASLGQGLLVIPCLC